METKPQYIELHFNEEKRIVNERVHSVDSLEIIVNKRCFSNGTSRKQNNVTLIVNELSFDLILMYQVL